MKKLRSSAEILNDLEVHKTALDELHQRQLKGDAPKTGYDPKTGSNIESTTLYLNTMISFYQSELEELKKCGEQIAFNF